MAEVNKTPKFNAVLLKSLTIGLGIGAIIIALILLLFSLLILKQVLPMSASYLLASVAGVIGSLAAGYISAKLYGNKGFMVGLLAGALIAALIFVVCKMILGFIFDYTVIFRFIAFIVAGAIGGIFGVNGKKSKYKRIKA